MDDVIDIVNKAASGADDREKAEAEERAARKQASNRRADVKIFFRAAAFAVFIAGLILAGVKDWMHPVLWGIFLMFGFLWFGCHFGAWHQFRARKEDKLYG